MEIVANGFNDAYAKSVEEIFLRPQFKSAPRDQKIHEILGLTITIKDPSINLFKNEIRSIPKKYLAQELALYYASAKNLYPSPIDEGLGRNVEELSFGEASAFWKKIATPQGTVNSSYGNLLFDTQKGETQSQWHWLLESFRKDLDTRQAIAHINRPFHQYDENKDFVCTMSYHFFVRDERVHLHVHRRSQDLFYGLTYDAPWELLLMQNMVSELSIMYPDRNFGLGEYKLFIGSAHIYERNFGVIRDMLDHPFLPDSLSADNYLPLYFERGGNKDNIRNGAWYIQKHRVNIYPHNKFLNWIEGNI